MLEPTPVSTCGACRMTEPSGLSAMPTCTRPRAASCQAACQAWWNEKPRPRTLPSTRPAAGARRRTAVPADALGAGAQDRLEALVRQRFPFVAEVADGHVDGVEAELLGERVHGEPQSHVELDVADAAHAAAGDRVRVHRVPLEPHRRYLRQQHLERIELQHHLHGRVRVLGVGAAVAERACGQRRDPSVARRAEAHRVVDRVARVVKVLAARVLEAHRASGASRQDGGEDEEDLVADVAAPERAAHVRADDADLVERQIQHLCDVHARLVGLVEVGPARELVALPVHQAAARVQAAVVGAVMAGRDLDGHVGGGEPCVHVAALVEDVLLGVLGDGEAGCSPR